MTRSRVAGRRRVAPRAPGAAALRCLAAAAAIALLPACAGVRRAPPPTDAAAHEGDDSDASAVEEGLASFYGRAHHGKLTASGERFDMRAMTCAHRRHRFGTLLRVVDVETGRSVVVRVNDRGPFTRGRIVDVSYAAARELGMLERGVKRVRVHPVEAR